jgi:protein-S-isoprenylcysteine O-methyltransferase Ste14
MRFLDYPPIWLAGFLGLAWAQSVLWPMGFGAGWAPVAGGLIALAGAGVMAAALPQFLRARTTIVPHRAPSALITSGIFRLTRNPIYLGDALILAGLAIRWQAWAALVLVPVFMRVIDRRFIRPEEGRLRAAFGAEFEAWAARVRRWL